MEANDLARLELVEEAEPNRPTLHRMQMEIIHALRMRVCGFT